MSHEAYLEDEVTAPESSWREAEVCGAVNFSDALASLRRLAVAHEDTAVIEGCAALAEKVQSRELNLVVVGQFKRGKTSFLNALMGSALLPVAVLPLTSVVTILRYGADPKAVVYFEDGCQQTVPTHRLEEFVTERGNPKNVKGVSRVEVYYPSAYLANNVRLIDTPGIGSVHDHNTEVTYRFVPRIDAAIFVTSPDPPLTASERELLASVAREVERVFLVVNKSDQVDARQLGEVVEFLRRNVPPEVKAVPVSAVSSRLALEAQERGDAARWEESGFPALEQRLEQFLRGEKEQLFDRVLRRRLASLAADLRIRLMLEAEAAQTPVEELRERLKQLNRHLAEATKEQEDSRLLLNGHLGRLEAEIEAAAKRFGAAQQEGVRWELEQRAQQWRGLSRREYAAQLDEELRRVIEQRFDEWLAGYEEESLARVRRLAGRFRDTVNELIRKVRDTAGTLFGIHLSGFDAEVELVVTRREGYFTDTLLSWGLGSFPLLLPRPLFERYIRKRLLEQIPDELERNATRRAQDLRRRVREGTGQFQKALEAQLGQTMERLRGAIEAALTLQAAGEAQARETIAKLRKAVARLEQLERELEQGGNKGRPQAERGEASRNE